MDTELPCLCTYAQVSHRVTVMQLGCGRCSEILGPVREENGHHAAFFQLGLRKQWVILAIVAIGIIIMGNSYIAWTVCQTLV